MFCNSCGANITPGHRYCPMCSKPVEGVAAAPVQRRVANHLTLLGSLWIAYSVLALFGAIILFVLNRTLFAALSARGEFGPPGGFLRPLFAVIGVFLLVKGSLCIITGIGLLTRQPWARILALIIGCISLLNIPFGTALGIYTIWVLLGESGDAEYRALTGQ
jgi:hypothetical protein